MVHPFVTEIVRADSSQRSFPRTQRELVALSLRVNPPVRTVKPVVEGGRRGGIFR